MYNDIGKLLHFFFYIIIITHVYDDVYILFVKKTFISIYSYI